MLLLEREHTGTVRVTGEMTVMEFNYQVDNPTLERFVFKVKEVLKMYPIIGTP